MSAVGQILLRFALGGVVVAVFAVFGDMLRPKRFAGVFGAAPAVALSTLTLTFVQKGAEDASIQGRSMVAGAAGFFVYCLVVSALLERTTWPAWAVAGASWLVWAVVAFGIWGIVLR